EVTGRLVIDAFGRAAIMARRAHLERPMDAARDGIDAACARLDHPPLSAATDGFSLRGYLRHRSFLAHVAAGTPGGYRRLFARSIERGATICDGGAHVARSTT